MRLPRHDETDTQRSSAVLGCRVDPITPVFDLHDATTIYRTAWIGFGHENSGSHFMHTGPQSTTRHEVGAGEEGAELSA